MSQHGTTESKMRQPEGVTTRLGRTSKPVARWIEAMITGNSRGD
jgi:hypothetical protein